MSRFSPYALVVIAWMLVCSLQYGYHISGLNQIQSALTCWQSGGDITYGRFGLPSCIFMSDAVFSLVTSIYTLGGFASSIGTNIIMDQYGRKSAVRLSSILTCLGSIIMGAASSVFPLLVGRFFIGLGAGIGICVVPAYLAEIAPLDLKDSVGLLNQLGIVTGILVTQIFGLVLATPGTWRTVFVISALVSAAQSFLALFMVDSPAWLNAQKRSVEAKAVSNRLWLGDIGTPMAEEDEAFLQDGTAAVSPPTNLSVWQALQIPELKRPLTVICSCMLLGQFSGINAVLSYSNDILSKVLPQAAPYISLGITIVNAFMTLPPIFLIPRIGKMNLLFISILGVFLSLVVLGYGIDQQHDITSSVAIITFVASFAVGLGPVSLILIPDISPFYAVSTISSVAFSLSWLVNFIVGATFLSVRNALSNEDGTGQGRVFYLSGTLVSLFALNIYRSY